MLFSSGQRRTKPFTGTRLFGPGNYTPPIGCSQVEFWMWGAGGAGGNSSLNGGGAQAAGTQTSFGTTTAKPGQGGNSNGNPGAGGTAGADGTFSIALRIPGMAGFAGVAIGAPGPASASGGPGRGASGFWGGTFTTDVGFDYSGMGGVGGAGSSFTGTTGGGGGAGEFVWGSFLVKQQAIPIPYVMGTKGQAPGGFGFGANGGDGTIILREWYW
jgi:hypothetical protein